ncbi:MAG: transposase domain-containing protein [Pedosphaera sp.]|nr:transposase domain-containing protein [Pedosphaera sp.]
MLRFLTYLYSLLITARRYGLDPVDWLTDVLRRIPQATNRTVAELLPWNWKPAKG